MRQNLFDPFLKNCGVVILDGAMATELEKRGADLNHALWSAKLLIENPSMIKEVHLDYLKAGADVITTASYQASFPGLAKQGYDKERILKFLLLCCSFHWPLWRIPG
jgi:homocysteine S-methyltransferase